MEVFGILVFESETVIQKMSFREQSNCVSTAQICLTIKFVCFINGLIFFYWISEDYF